MQTGLVCEFSESYLDETSQTKYRTAWDSITAIGIGSADTLYANTKNVQKILLPLKQDKDSTQFAITYHNETDTLVIYHSNQQNFVSVECGCTYDYDILKLNYTHHWIDSISVVQTAVSLQGATNIRFLRDAVYD